MERFWFELESNILLSQIVSAVFFVFLNTFQCSKIKSVWKPKKNKADKKQHKWIPGRKADFLEKLKFEFMNYTFLGQNVVHVVVLLGFTEFLSFPKSAQDNIGR